MESAEEYIGSMLHVYCLNRREFEPNQMSITPSGDMIDDKGHIHSAKRHIPFVLYGTANVAIKMAKEEMKQKAIEAFKFATDGYFIVGGTDYSENRLKEFVEKLNL